MIPHCWGHNFIMVWRFLHIFASSICGETSVLGSGIYSHEKQVFCGMDNFSNKGLSKKVKGRTAAKRKLFICSIFGNFFKNFLRFWNFCAYHVVSPVFSSSGWAISTRRANIGQAFLREVFLWSSSFYRNQFFVICYFPTLSPLFVCCETFARASSETILGKDMKNTIPKFRAVLDHFAQVVIKCFFGLRRQTQQCIFHRANTVQNAFFMFFATVLVNFIDRLSSGLNIFAVSRLQSEFSTTCHIDALESGFDSVDGAQEFAHTATRILVVCGVLFVHFRLLWLFCFDACALLDIGQPDAFLPSSPPVDSAHWILVSFFVEATWPSRACYYNSMSCLETFVGRNPPSRPTPKELASPMHRLTTPKAEQVPKGEARDVSHGGGGGELRWGGPAVEDLCPQYGGLAGWWNVSPSRRMFGPEYSSDNAGDGHLTSEELAFLEAFKVSAPELCEAFLAFLKEWTPSGGVSFAQVTPPQSPQSYSDAARQAPPPPAAHAREGETKTALRGARQLPSPRELARRFAVWRRFRCTPQGLSLVMTYLDLVWTGGKESLFKQWQLLSREATKASAEAFGCVVKLLMQTGKKESMSGKTSQPAHTHTPPPPPLPPPSTVPHPSDTFAWNEKPRTAEEGGDEGSVTDSPPSPEKPFGDLVSRLRAEQLAAAAKAQTRRAEESARRQKGTATKADRKEKPKRMDKDVPKPAGNVGERRERVPQLGQHISPKGAKGTQAESGSGAGAIRRLQSDRAAERRALEAIGKVKAREDTEGMRKTARNRRKKKNRRKKVERELVRVNSSTERALAEAQEQELERAPAEAQEGEEAALRAPPPAAQVGVGSEGQVAGVEDGPPPAAADTPSRAHVGAGGEGEAVKEAPRPPAGEGGDGWGGEELEEGEEGGRWEGGEGDAARLDAAQREEARQEDVARVLQDCITFRQDLRSTPVRAARAYCATLFRERDAKLVPLPQEEAGNEELRWRAHQTEGQQAVFRLEEQRVNAAEGDAAAGSVQAVQHEGGRRRASAEDVWNEVARVRALRGGAQQTMLRLEEHRSNVAEGDAAAGTVEVVPHEGERGNAVAIRVPGVRQLECAIRVPGEGKGEETVEEEGGVEAGGSTEERHRAFEADLEGAMQQLQSAREVGVQKGADATGGPEGAAEHQDTACKVVTSTTSTLPTNSGAHGDSSSTSSTLGRHSTSFPFQEGVGTGTARPFALVLGDRFSKNTNIVQVLGSFDADTVFPEQSVSKTKEVSEGGGGCTGPLSEVVEADGVGVEGDEADFLLGGERLEEEGPTGGGEGDGGDEESEESSEDFEGPVWKGVCVRLCGGKRGSESWWGFEIATPAGRPVDARYGDCPSNLRTKPDEEALHIELMAFIKAMELLLVHEISGGVEIDYRNVLHASKVEFAISQKTFDVIARGSNRDRKKERRGKPNSFALSCGWIGWAATLLFDADRIWGSALQFGFVTPQVGDTGKDAQERLCRTRSSLDGWRGDVEDYVAGLLRRFGYGCWPLNDDEVYTRNHVYLCDLWEMYPMLYKRVHLPSKIELNWEAFHGQGDDMWEGSSPCWTITANDFFEWVRGDLNNPDRKVAKLCLEECRDYDEATLLLLEAALAVAAAPPRSGERRDAVSRLRDAEDAQVDLRDRVGRARLACWGHTLDDCERGKQWDEDTERVWGEILLRHMAPRRAKGWDWLSWEKSAMRKLEESRRARCGSSGQGEGQNDEEEDFSQEEGGGGDEEDEGDFFSSEGGWGGESEDEV